MTPEHHELRRSFIGGSDAAAIVAGGEEWVKLWRVKTGLVPSDDPEIRLWGNEFYQRWISRNPQNIDLSAELGKWTEPFNIEWYTKQTGRLVTRRGEIVRHLTMPYLGCTLDGETMTSAGEAASFQAKHVGKSGDQVTLRYTSQCTHEALVLGYEWWVMSTLIGNSKWELTEQEVDPFFAADYLQKCAEFWSFVEADKEPPPAEPLPVPAPRRLRKVVVDLENPASNWEHSIVPPVSQFLSTEAAAKANAIARERIKELLPEDVGECVIGLVELKRDKAGKLTISTKRAREKNDD